MYRSMIQTRVDYLMNAGGSMGMVQQSQHEMGIVQRIQQQMSLTQWAESQMNLVQRMERQMSLVRWAEREVGIAQRIQREMNSMELIKQPLGSTAWMAKCCLPTIPARLTPLMGSPEQPAISDDEEPAESPRERSGFLDWDGRPRR